MKDKVRQIVKILNRSGILTEQISFKKLPRPEGCKLTIDFLHGSCVSSPKYMESCSKPYLRSIVLMYEIPVFRMGIIITAKKEWELLSHQDHGVTNS